MILSQHWCWAETTLRHGRHGRARWDRHTVGERNPWLKITRRQGQQWTQVGGKGVASESPAQWGRPSGR